MLVLQKGEAQAEGVRREIELGKGEKGWKKGEGRERRGRSGFFKGGGGGRAYNNGGYQSKCNIQVTANLVPRALRVFGKQVGTRRESGDSAYPLTKEHKDSGYKKKEIATCFFFVQVQPLIIMH